MPRRRKTFLVFEQYDGSFSGSVTQGSEMFRKAHESEDHLVIPETEFKRAIAEYREVLRRRRR